LIQRPVLRLLCLVVKDQNRRGLCPAGKEYDTQTILEFQA